VTAHYAVLKL